jgi:chloramphenicol O-acetyltransferase type A
MGRYIELDGWKRREHYAFFKNFHNPFFSICTDVDVSALYRLSKTPGGPSFSLASLFLSLHAANEVKEFRLRLREQGVWLHDEVHAGSTVLLKNETFAFAYFQLSRDFIEFQARGQEEIRHRMALPTLAGGAGEDNLIHYSVLPWIRFTSFTNALRLGEDSIPKIVFGKYYSEAGVCRMPISVEVHHALVDGIHVARFLERFQEKLNSPQL